MQRSAPSILVAATLLLAPLCAAADAIVVSRAMLASTIAEIFVREAGLRAEFEIGVADLEAFRDLLPDALHEKLGHAPEPLEQRHARFFREGWVIEPDGGPPLAGRVARLEARARVGRDEITGEPSPGAETQEPEPVIFVALEYAFAERPRRLAFRTPGGSAVARAAVGFVAYHEGLPINDFRYLGPSLTLDLDWEDPFYSRFQGRNLRRRYDAPLNVFLYVEPYEVRVEVIARPRDLEQWVDLGVGGLSSLSPDAQPEIRRRAAEFLEGRLDLRVDGRPVAPALERVHFLRRTLRTSRVTDPTLPLDATSATLGAIYVASLPEPLPREVTLHWPLFGGRIQRVPAAATDEAGPLPGWLTPDDPVLRWQNFLKRPTLPTLVTLAAPPGAGWRALGWAGWLALGVLGVAGWRVAREARRGGAPSRRAWLLLATLLLASLAGLAGARRASVDDARAREIVGGLLHNVYRAFDFREEEAIYDVLARSVHGDLLARLYLETRKGLELASQGGARAKVKQVEVLAVAAGRLDDGAGFAARATWNVRGSVGHWGHVHQRTNQYEARLSVQPVDGAWKITGLDLLQEQRL